MNEELIKHVKQVRLELEQLKIRLDALEYKVNCLSKPNNSLKAESKAKELYNKVWEELGVEEKLMVLEGIKNGKD